MHMGWSGQVHAPSDKPKKGQVKKKNLMGWKEVSVFKCMCCSCRGPKLSSQFTHWTAPNSNSRSEGSNFCYWLLRLPELSCIIYIDMHVHIYMKIKINPETFLKTLLKLYIHIHTYTRLFHSIFIRMQLSHKRNYK